MLLEVTTDEVRDAFTDVSEDLWSILPPERCREISDSLGESFDRWLEEHDRQVSTKVLEDLNNSKLLDGYASLRYGISRRAASIMSGETDG